MPSTAHEQPDQLRSGESWPGLAPHRAISIIIPAHNEARRIGPTLARIRGYFTQAGQRFEVLVVDDGSRDATADAVRRFAAESPPVRLLVNARRRGKGYSVRQGMLVATGDLLLMCDADLSTPIEEVAKLLGGLADGCDVVIGSRDLPESQLSPPQPLLRRRLALVFRTIRRLLMLPALRDTQCGFKLFRRDAAREIFARQRINGWLFDCEALGIAERLGYRIREVGVRWRDCPDSRVNVLREALWALPTLLLIRLRLMRIE